MTGWTFGNHRDTISQASHGFRSARGFQGKGIRPDLPRTVSASGSNLFKYFPEHMMSSGGGGKIMERQRAFETQSPQFYLQQRSSKIFVRRPKFNVNHTSFNFNVFLYADGQGAVTDRRRKFLHEIVWHASTRPASSFDTGSRITQIRKATRHQRMLSRLRLPRVK